MPLGTLTTRSVSRACAAATLGTPTGVTVGEFGPFIFGRLQSYIYTRNSFPNPPNGGNSRGNSRTVNREGCHSVAAVHERSDERVASVPKGVRSAHTQKTNSSTSTVFLARYRARLGRALAASPLFPTLAAERSAAQHSAGRRCVSWRAGARVAPSRGLASPARARLVRQLPPQRAAPACCRAGGAGAG